MINPSDIFDVINIELKKNKLTMTKMCEAIDINRSTLYFMSNRNTYPSLEVLYKVCKYLDLSIDDLLDLSPDTTPDPICSLVKTLNDNQKMAVVENIETVKKFVK